VKISIENFKSIRQLHEFEIKPMTILSGVNSSGKSSFIQFLLLLKQSLEKSSTKEVLDLNGKYFKTKNYEEIIYLKNHDNDIEFKISFYDKWGSLPPLLRSLGFEIINAKVIFSFSSNKLGIKSLELGVSSSNQELKKFLHVTKNDNDTYKIEADSDEFGKGIWNKNIHASIQFNSIYPLTWEVTESLESEFGEFDKKTINAFNISWIKNGIDSVFENIYYIGPARVKPKEIYNENGDSIYVGSDGKYTAQIMHDLASEEVASRKLIEEDTTFRYEALNGELLDVINYWLCDYFGIGGEIYAKKENDNFKIFLQNENDLEVNIRHVGYGISQILPIIVQGLLLAKGQTLIIEQPELHLHPKLQSKLYDFLYSLTLKEVKVIVETHSSHFITRMRRRIAEDLSNEMDDNINLTFIENGVFSTLEIDDYAVMNYYPEDFIESYETEISALIQAQMNKRLKRND